MGKDTVIDKRIRVADTKPHPRNYNQHDEAQVEDLRESLRQFGQVRSVVVQASKRNGSYLTVAGHGIIEAARLEGITHLRANVIPASWSSALVLAYLAADNELARRGTPDEAQLARLVAEVQEREGDVLARLAAGEKKALERLLKLARNGDGGADAEPQIDRAAELQRKWGVKLGDLWRIGEHRLLCGDSTRREDVEKVMRGERARMVFTDPPYNVSYQDNESIESLKARHRRTDGLIVNNDSMSDEEFDEFLVSFLSLLPIIDGGVFYLCAPPGRTETQFRNAIDCVSGLALRECIVWVKDAFVFGRQDYHWRHESILYGWKDGGAHYFVDDRTQDTVWEFDRPHISKEHPTVKPVEMAERAIENSSRRDEIVFDGFVGSGTTLIACENLGRLCRAIEIAPQYVAVALQRYLDAFGIEPRLIESGNGKAKAKRKVATQQATPATR